MEELSNSFFIMNLNKNFKASNKTPLNDGKVVRNSNDNNSAFIYKDKYKNEF